MAIKNTSILNRTFSNINSISQQKFYWYMHTEYCWKWFKILQSRTKLHFSSSLSSYFYDPIISLVFDGTLIHFYVDVSNFIRVKSLFYCGGGHLTTVAVANSENFLSIGILSSYNVGAWRIIPAVPTNTANVNIHKNRRSNTIATYFQSSLTWNRKDDIIICWVIMD